MCFSTPNVSQIDQGVWFEERPKKIVGDFAILQKREKAMRRGLLGCFDEVDEEVQVLKAGSIIDGLRLYVALIQLQFVKGGV